MHDEISDESGIVATVRALEAADAMLRPQEWPALADRHLREQVGQRLQGLGRQLLTVTDEAAGTVEGYLSGWSDEAAEYLARDPNALQANDLAVLTLIYLHSEILERILGEEGPAGGKATRRPRGQHRARRYPRRRPAGKPRPAQGPSAHHPPLQTRSRVPAAHSGPAPAA